MFSPILFCVAAILISVSATQHDVRSPQITEATRTLLTLSLPEPSDSDLARLGLLMVRLDEHELKARSPAEIAANTLHKRACNDVSDVDCGNRYCCSNAQRCEVTNGITRCRSDGNSFLSASSAYFASNTSSGKDRPTGASGGRSGRRYSRGLRGGAIAGIVIGIAVAAMLLAGYFWWKKRRGSANRDLGAYSPAYTSINGNPPPNPNHEHDPIDMYGGSNYGKGGVAGPPPPEYSNELDSRERPRRPEMDTGMDAIPPRETTATTTSVVSKPEAAELPVTNGRPDAELAP